jgi:hypothetical protein
MGVDFSNKPEGGDPNDGTKYANKRAEIWGRMRAWLSIGSIPERIPGMFGTEEGVARTLVDELVSPNYGLNTQEAIQLESKKDMRRRGVASPNVADALACTFAFDVWQPTDEEREALPVAKTESYNPYTQENIYAESA